MKENFQPFVLEREMGHWEHKVDFNLSESGVHPMTTEELLGGDRALMDELLNVELNYPYTNGEELLRARIADTYDGATADDVIATCGAAQANLTTVLSLLDPGDEIVVMLPNYMQIWGIAQNYGLKTRTFSLEEDLKWGFDIDKFNDTVTSKTRLIAICNPNNPTGHIMTAEERAAVVSAAEKCGAWILSDEVYAGAEHNTDEVTPSMWGTYERVAAIGSMSKAYALPGLRLGWVVSNPEMAEALWARQDYITICPTMLANRLGAHALKTEVRERILGRTRAHVRRGFSNLRAWVDDHADTLSLIPPEAAAIGFVHYRQKVNSTEVVQRLIRDHSTYVVPGDHFGMDSYLRISYGLSDEYVNEGLRRVYIALSAS